GDRLLSIDGQSLPSWESMSEAIAASNGRPMRIEVERLTDDKVSTTLHLEMTAERSTRKTIFGEDESAWLIGIRAGSHVVTHPKGFFEAAWAGAAHTWQMVSLTWQSFVKLAQRVVPLEQVGGPIMIAQMVGEQAQAGMAGLLALTALISINLGILNLLPIPMLDGGTIVFCLWEMIFRRPLPPKVQEWAMRVGLALLIGLMVLATFNDVWRIFKS
ncbi:MAG: RIP metalloprotease RseP, partial [Desulfovibrionaceae bacterium]|nr:RIP metalloprotease RseP [Desulfovibrionaceae bacterium]